MSANPTNLLKTGHEEIDREHAVLLDLLTQLDGVCLVTPMVSAVCTGCSAGRHRACEDALLDILTRVLGFTVDHFAFEEKAMHWLPGSPERAAHCDAHIEDHARISKALHDLAVSLAPADIIGTGIELQTVIRCWLGEHIMNFDLQFVRLLNAEG